MMVRNDKLDDTRTSFQTLNDHRKTNTAYCNIGLRRETVYCV